MSARREKIRRLHLAYQEEREREMEAVYARKRRWAAWDLILAVGVILVLVVAFGLVVGS